MTKTEPERLAVLETKVTSIEQGQARIENKVDRVIDKIDNNLVNQLDFNTLVNEVEKLKNSKQLQHWLVRMALVISSLLNVFAVFEYLTKG